MSETPERHRYQQLENVAVNVCVCGKWPMNHVHLGESPRTCGCDGCRAPDSIFDQVREYVLSTPVAPTPGRLEVGTLAHIRITEAARPPMEARPWERPALSAMYGLPVVPNPAMDALAWRILDRDGKVIDRGLMSP